MSAVCENHKVNLCAGDILKLLAPDLTKKKNKNKTIIADIPYFFNSLSSFFKMSPLRLSQYKDYQK